MEKEQAIQILVDLINQKEKEAGLAQGLSEEYIDAYAIINKEQVVAYVSNAYDLLNEAGLLK